MTRTCLKQYAGVITASAAEVEGIGAVDVADSLSDGALFDPSDARPGPAPGRIVIAGRYGAEILGDRIEGFLIREAGYNYSLRTMRWCKLANSYSDRLHVRRSRGQFSCTMFGQIQVLKIQFKINRKYYVK